MEQITINLLATGVTPVCHVSQFDDGRTIRINLKKGADIFTLSGTEEVKMRIRKPDNTERVVDIINTASSYVDYVSTPEDCDIEGVNVCELVIDDLGSKNFLMNVEEDAYGGGADIETLTASGPIATFETNMVDNLVDLKAEITPIQNLHGYDYPWTAGGGKNLIDVEDTSVSINNAYYASVTLGFAPKADTTYTISVEVNATVTPFNISVGCGSTSYATDIATKSNLNNGKIDITFTPTAEQLENKPYIFLRVPRYRTQQTATATLKKFMLEKGSSATEYAPYSNICPIEGHTEAKIVHKGKNLINDAIKCAYSGNIVYIGQTDNNYRIFLKAGTYTVSVDFNGVPYGFYFKSANSANEKIWGSGSGITSATFVIPEDGYYRFWVYYNPNTGTIDVNNLRQIQIELGSEVTDYEPYTGTEVTVQFGQTVYKGVLDAKNSKIIATHAYATINPSTILKYGTWDGTVGAFWYTTSIAGDWDNSSTNNGVSCDSFVLKPNIAQVHTENGMCWTTAKIVRWIDVPTMSMTLEEYKTYVSTHPINCLFKLKTPVEIPLSTISQFETFLGVNNVYSDIGDAELKYLKQV